MKILAVLLVIGRWGDNWSIDKKPPKPNGERGRKIKRSKLGFFSSNPEHALPLQRGVERFNYCELSSSQISHSFLVLLGDPVDLVCSWNRGSRSRRFDVQPERDNSLVRLVYTINRANLASSMRIAWRWPTLCNSCTIAIFVCQVDNRCKQAQAQFLVFFVSAAL